MKRLMSLTAIFLFLLLVTNCGDNYGHMRGWGPMMNDGYGYGYGYGGMFMGLIFLIFIVVAVYFIVQALRGKNVIGQAQENHLDILKKRYAKGEITKEEFDRMKNELQ